MEEGRGQQVLTGGCCLHDAEMRSWHVECDVLVHLIVWLGVKVCKTYDGASQVPPHPISKAGP